MPNETEQLWTKFNNRKIAAERAKKDWNGRDLTSITGANDSTITVNVVDSSTPAGSFTTNQASAGTVNIPAATTTSPGAMTAADKTKLDGLLVSNVVDSGTNGNLTVTYTNGTTTDIPVYGHPTSGATAGSYGDTAAQSPAFGGTFKVTSTTVDNGGHVTAIAEHNVTIPSDTATTSAAGLMSATDKTKLEGIAAGAEVNVQADWNVSDSTLDSYIANKPTIPAAANDAALNLALGSATATQVFSADASTASTITIPLASADTTGATPVYMEGLMTGQDKEHVDWLVSVTPGTGTTYPATPTNPLITQDEMEAAIADFGGFEIATGTGADLHPNVQNPSTKIIYLVKDTSATGSDLYKEWICTNTTGPTWELIGDTSMNLNGYAKIPSSKAATHIVTFGSDDTLVDSGKTVADLENVVTTVSIGGGTPINPTGNTTNIDIPVATNSISGAMSSTDKAKLDGITNYLVSASVSGKTLTITPSSGSNVTFTGDENVIESISVNGTAVTPDANKNVALTVPTAAASTDTPAMDGTAAVGSSSAYARADHVHPSDTAKADKVSSPTAGNLVQQTSDGNITDAGVAAADLIAGVKLEGASNPLPPTSGVVTIPNVISTGTAGASNGLMTANQSLMLDQIGAWTWSYAEFSGSGMGTESTATFPFAVSNS